MTLVVAIVLAALAIASLRWAAIAEKESLAKAVAGAGWSFLAPMSLVLFFYAALIRWAESHSGDTATLGQLRRIAETFEALESNKILSVIRLGGATGFGILVVLAVLQIVVRRHGELAANAYKTIGRYKKLVSFGFSVITFLTCFTLFDGESKAFSQDLSLHLKEAHSKLEGFRERAQEAAEDAAIADVYRSAQVNRPVAGEVDRKRQGLAARTASYERDRRTYELDFGGTHPEAAPVEASPAPTYRAAAPPPPAAVPDTRNEDLTIRQVEQADREMADVEAKAQVEVAEAEHSVLATKIPTGAMKLALNPKLKLLYASIAGNFPLLKEILEAVGEVVVDRLGERLDKISERFVEGVLGRDKKVDLIEEAHAAATESIAAPASAALASALSPRAANWTAPVCRSPQ
ncbi:hypothetical protein [Fimbriimonas ginsengisoli]|uniref:Uncharacterized protein n=1 Tax=Fimbriimonas ginsengisoli Gsoil 348 TaxID=661478 RepID=A0A068NXA1_FIMGI|nr:hypothetical protein [Fimbriimonas ginsengisoli]AIE88143.1 hypothetical protein OP10G_4775 [Fimbriimonas ginsengisoli Gsoil 348]